VQIETRLHHDLWQALVDPTQLELAILNLAINARDAMQVGGKLQVSTSNVTRGAPIRPEEPPAGEYVAVCVSDSGSGMADEVRAKVFEPFFTTKDVGKGSGLGLSQVLGFAKQSGGGVQIESTLGRGTSVWIFLPRTEREAVRATPVDVRPARARDSHQASILLVDDDNAVREVTRAILHELGYFVFEAGSGGAALDLLEREANIGLIIVDFAMPGMNGAELTRLVQVKRPRLPVLFITGFADRAALGNVSETSIIRKPFTDDELASKVAMALMPMNGRGAAAQAGRLAQAGPE
jgi:CheY-like chemotaxis protein